MISSRTDSSGNDGWLKGTKKMGTIKHLIKQYVIAKRHAKYRKVNIKNQDVSIFSNCCIGGTMYNDLGLRFLRPTINLFFGHHGFIDWVLNYEEYRDATLYDTGKFDINEHGLHGPICLLKKTGLPDIEIHFLHYSSFEEAEKKWYERFSRINPDKIFIVVEAKEPHEHEIIEEYVSLPYPKVIFTDLPSNKDKGIMHMSIYDTDNGKAITSLLGLSGRRAYDEFDFVNEIFNRSYDEVTGGNK